MITVIGSINVDFVVTAEEIPKVGETLFGKSFAQHPGGKGANQAVAAARMNVPVAFLGMVGNDIYGEYMLSKMSGAGVDVSRVERAEVATGVAFISVDSDGGNSILVVHGANAELDAAYAERCAGAIAASKLVLAQHETPLTATKRAFEIAKGAGAVTVLNPAPALEVTDEMLALTDILVPNEYELARITRMPAGTRGEIERAAAGLVERGVKTLIVTLGAKGVALVTQGGIELFEAFSVKAVDTTAAGDGFLGGFASEYAKSGDVRKSVMTGQGVAALAVMKEGAQSSMPDYDTFCAFMAEHGSC